MKWSTTVIFGSKNYEHWGCSWSEFLVSLVVYEQSESPIYALLHPSSVLTFHWFLVVRFEVRQCCYRTIFVLVQMAPHVQLALGEKGVHVSAGLIKVEDYKHV